MIYLLGGASRTGKTTIARAFLAETGIPFFNPDFLMMGFVNGLPAYGVDSEADELRVAEQPGPVVRSMVAAMVEEEIDYLVEGVQNHPRCAGELQAELADYVRICFIGMAEADTRTKFQEIRRYGGGTDDWMHHYPDERVLQEVERLKGLSLRLRDACAQYGLKYIEASNNLTSTIAAVIGYFLE
jgi:hypothetical protein